MKKWSFIPAVAVVILVMLAAIACNNGGGSDDEATPTAPSGPFALTSSAFGEGAAIPAKYSCDGANVSPPLQWINTPGGTQGLALIVDDPDAPGGTWVHWLLYSIGPEVTAMAEGAVPAGGVQGANSWGRNSYGGPCPPGGTHRYNFKLYALNAQLNLNAGATKAELLAAMDGRIIEQVQLMGRYTR